MEAEFDIDKFQNELNAAEIYLRGEIGKTSSRILGHPGKNFRISEFNKSNNEMVCEYSFRFVVVNCNCPISLEFY
jgi:hypothetical protein